MATTVKDLRIVRVTVTIDELNNLISTKANQLGFIDFDPTAVNLRLLEPGGDYEIVFEKDVTP